LSRQAFLLTALEGFSEAEAAQTLNLDRMVLAGLIDRAGRDLAAEIATDVLIIEDDEMTDNELEELVEDLGHHVVGIARTKPTSRLLATAKPPGLILADVRLADGSGGVDAVNDLLTTFQVPVVFITGYVERLLDCERPEPAFTLRKPFRRATCVAVISQALFFHHKARQTRLFKAA
jgi:DNA-binding NtrC family response regulator